MGVEKMSKTRKVEAFFLEAVKGGWVAGGRGKRYSGDLLCRRIRIEGQNGFSFVEVYKVWRTSLHDGVKVHFAGRKTISHWNRPMWSMISQGFCREEHLSFFKESVAERYRCRGLLGREMIRIEDEVNKRAFDSRALFPHGSFGKFCEEVRIFTLYNDTRAQQFLALCTLSGGFLDD